MTSKNKRTKGPWKVKRIDSMGGPWEIYDSSNRVVVGSNVGYGKELGINGGIYELEKAKLIAASPDLLNAAIELVKSADNDLDPGHVSRIIVDLKFVEELRTAIKKAKGEQ